MPQQLTFLDLQTAESSNPGNGEFMLWYEDTDAEPEEAIKNAGRYYYQKYGTRPVRVVLPLKWRGKDHNTIKIKPLEEALGLAITTSKVITTKHVAVYISPEE